MTNLQDTKSIREVEVSLFDILAFFKRHLVLLVSGAILFGIIGLAYSYTLEKKYTAQTVLLPEMGTARGESFFSMAIGANANDPSGKLVPDLYPNVLSTVPFSQHLLLVPVTDSKNKTYPSLQSYITRDTSTPLLERILLVFKSKDDPKSKANSQTLFKDDEIASFTYEQEGLINAARGLVKANIDKIDRLVTIECEMDDPVVAAILVNESRKYLVSYVSDYAVSKSTQQVSFLGKRVAEAQKRQQKAEYALQTYRDANRNAFLNVARIHEQRLQAEYVLSQSIYSDLLIKLEQAKIREKEDRPVFKVLNPVKVPLGKSSPNRPLMGIIFSVVGIILTLGYVVFFKEKLHSKLM